MQLSADERVELLRFLCWFAYADLSLDPREYDLIDSFAGTMRLNGEQREQVQGWLEDPPDLSLEDVKNVPAEKRELYLDALMLLGNADRNIHSMESKLFERISEIWATPGSTRAT